MFLAAIWSGPLDFSFNVNLMAANRIRKNISFWNYHNSQGVIYNY